MCSFCERKPFIDKNGEYFGFESEETITSGPWTDLKSVIEEDGKLAIFARGDGDTDRYYPKFCPECGKRLCGGDST